MRRLKTKSEKETFELGRELAGRLAPGTVVAVSGGLGVGKTVFVKGLAKGLGIERPVLSPTFTLLRQYDGLNHFDVYRIDDPAELAEIGFEEFLSDGNITVIEWAEKVAELLPEDTVWVTIAGGDADGERTVEIDGV